MSFMRLRKFSIPSLLSVFINEKILSDALSVSVEIIMCFLFFILLLYYINSFSDVKPTLHSCDKSHIDVFLTYVINKFILEGFQGASP